MQQIRAALILSPTHPHRGEMVQQRLPEGSLQGAPLGRAMSTMCQIVLAHLCKGNQVMFVAYGGPVLREETIEGNIEHVCAPIGEAMSQRE